jgi:primosomal protein N'
MEAAEWAAGREAGARVLVQTRRPGHPAIQALVRWEPEPYLDAEGEAGARAGFPPGHPVFRIEGAPDLEASLAAARPESLLSTESGEGTVCLVAIHPDRMAAFRELVRRLASQGLVRRVEAEPQL